MSKIIPNNNLPESSQPWGREIQKTVEDLDSRLSLLKTNTEVVDRQLQSSYKRLGQTVRDLDNVTFDINNITEISNEAVSTANAALAGLNSLATPGSSYSVNIANVSGVIPGLPAGGSINNILVKLSSTDYDAGWSNVINGGSA
jgi:methyl-accepting chemotaxis protein